MLGNGFITLYRKFTEWQWYNEPLTNHIYVHLLLTANYEDKKWRNIPIKRGQRIVTFRGLADELEITTKTLRLHLDRLSETGEIICKTYSRYTLITIPKYSQYQDLKKSIVVKNNTISNTISNTIGNTVSNTYETNNNHINNKKKQDSDSLSPLEAVERSESSEPDMTFDSFGFRTDF